MTGDLRITPDQIRAARKLLGWSSGTLAKRAGKSPLAIVSTAAQFQASGAE